ncbi:MAG: InlB B-repeat-containing protein [Treponema sp.]|jgi:uncharacterized repeat protein (TIGR02543 family)|nr:InlB B-repeat-containing protein [Treponema sp.]
MYVRNVVMSLCLFFIFSACDIEDPYIKMYNHIHKTVTFDSRGGAPAGSKQTVFYGNMVKKPASPVKSGNNFSGWYANKQCAGKPYDFNKPVTSDMTLYAGWGKSGLQYITYTLAQVGGADNTANTTGITFAFSESINSLGVTAANITVTGAAEKGSATFTGSGANWMLSPITVSYAGLATVTISKTGIEADGRTVLMYKQGETAPEYWNVAWRLNGGTAATGSVYPELAEKDSPLAKPDPDPIRTGYVFENWCSNAGLTTVYDFSSPVTADITLYAKWKELSSAVSYTVTFNSNGGSSVTAQTITSLPLRLPETSLCMPDGYHTH